MRKRRNPMLTLAAIILAPLAAAQLSNAQIANEIVATIEHPFTIGNTTLPSGKYDFRMLQGSSMTVMTITNANDRISEEFLVRASDAKTAPTHTELVFNCYGNREFLTRIYEGGSRAGVAVEEPSRQELRLQKQGQSPVERTETQTS
ncbi:MAG TPA: hypothetical protein VMF91_13160 [Bryobacteraceae bacterium]|nr:hypothetical protein [Bryobacteraceae bacterium]